ncbi:SymE family type I addiction module toxin [Stenotrophomonas sp.]|uniref:SymE family type I addiction module toxin n=1 Tax=Stenotrophomonas sp. TaxID=69392 RepID=UPI0028AA3425|nr:SymE family type I addiction module toxin [Stenotrophomonas sp.]
MCDCKSDDSTQKQYGFAWAPPETIRISKVKLSSGQLLPDNESIPSLLLRGMWLVQWGYRAGCRVRVRVNHRRIVLTLIDPSEQRARGPGMVRRWAQAAMRWVWA